MVYELQIILYKTIRFHSNDPCRGMCSAFVNLQLLVHPI